MNHLNKILGISPPPVKGAAAYLRKAIAAAILCMGIAANAQNDIAINKVGPLSAQAGSTISYNIHVTNNGTGNATNVVVKDSSVANFTVTGITCAAGAGTLGSASCPASVTVAGLQGAGLTIPSLPEGSGVTFTITGTAGSTEGAVITNTATVESLNDPVTTNNTSTVNTQLYGCTTDESVYTLDPAATLSSNTIAVNGGTVNLVYKLTSGTAVPGIGSQFTLPVQYSDLENKLGVDNRWEGLGTITIASNNFVIAPRTTAGTGRIYNSLPANNTTNEAFLSPDGIDNIFTTYIRTGNLDPLGKFSISMGNYPTAPAGYVVKGHTLNIMASGNLSSTASAYNSGFWQKPLILTGINSATDSRTLPVAVMPGDTYVWRYSAFGNAGATNGSNTRGVLFPATNSITFAKTCPDTDGDGVLDINDLDDDNDGILDTDEMGCGVNIGVIPTTVTTTPVTSSYPALGLNLTLSKTGSGTVNRYLQPTLGSYGLDGSSTANTKVIYEFSVPVTNFVFWLTDLNYRENVGVNYYDAQGNRISDLTPYITQNVLTGTTRTNTSNATYGLLSATNAGSVQASELANYVEINTGDLFISKIEFTLISTAGGATPGYHLKSLCAARDTDGDGIPDYLDLDSDNDGCPDAIEGDENVTPSQLNPDGSINISANGGIDADGVPNLVNSGGAADIDGDQGQGIGTSQNASQNVCKDTDGDGVPDYLDLDNDNDGIQDTDERICGDWSIPTSVSTSYGTINSTFTNFNNTGIDFKLSTSGSSNARRFNNSGGGAPINFNGIEPNGQGSVVTYEFSQPLQNLNFYIGDLDQQEGVKVNYYDESNNRITNLLPYASIAANNLGGISISNDASNGLITNNTNNTNSNASHLNMVLINTTGLKISKVVIEFYYRVSDARPDYYFSACADKDTNNDGIPDYLDLDSDGDTCPDATEGTMHITDLNPDGSIAGAVDANGVPVLANGGQDVGFSQNVALNACLDTDSDGVPDVYDLDNDNDGILDNDERICGDWSIPTSVSTSYGTINSTFTNFNNTGIDFKLSTSGSSNARRFNNSGGGAPINFNGIEPNGQGSVVTYEFSQPLQNLKFYIGDLDQQEGVKVNYYDESNNRITNLLPYASIEANNLGGISISNDASNGLITNNTNNTNSNASHLNMVVINTTGLKISKVVIEFYYRVSDARPDYYFSACADKDTDNDGIPDYLDLDSDGDGCPDAMEGDENVSPSQLNPDGSINITDNGGVDADGVPNLVNSGGVADIGGDQGQGIGDSQDGDKSQCFCTEDPETGTPDGFTKVGISTLASQPDGWPENIPNGWITMDSKTQGFVITRVQHVGGTNGAPVPADSVTDPQEGMIVYDIDDACVKLFNGTVWNCIERSCNN